MASVVDFVKSLQFEIENFPNSKILFCVQEGKRELTNAIFLLGSYMILKMNLSALEVSSNFSWADTSLVEPYRDATFVFPDFRLRLIDCWKGLEKGKSLGWVNWARSGYMWGAIDIEQYEHYNNPINGCLHVVVPGKFVAFQGPHDLGGKDFLDDERGCRTFGAPFIVQVLLDLGVSDVVRLNEPCYDAAAFTSHGLRHHDMEFPDCTAPPDTVAAAFLAAAAAAPGAVAVHCKAGLGRTGTLIALYMMKHHGFTAREAMGWLRIMRPGSVIGEQQRYLCSVGENDDDDDEDEAEEYFCAIASAQPPFSAFSELAISAAAAAAAAAEPPAAAHEQQSCDYSAAAAAAAADRSPAELARQVAEGMRRHNAAAAARAPP
jgi:cell division cycle 14